MSTTVAPVAAPPKAMEKIRRALIGGHPLVYVQSWEEPRVERLVQHFAKTFFGQAVPFGVWSVVDGLLVDGMPVPDTRDPLKALDAILQASGKGFFLLKDFPTSAETRPDIVRRLRDLYRGLKDRGRHVLLLSPRLNVPEDLKKEIYVIEYELPDEAEITRIIDASVRRRLGVDSIDDQAMRRLALAMRGLTADEIGHLLGKVFAQRKSFDESGFLEVLAEKEQMSKKEGVLEFVPPRYSLEDIGGYDTLKAWLRKRQALFSKEALDAGIPIPRGLLLMGISGCGKSLCVKTISTLWNLPLFRLDMNAVFGTENPESTFLRALRSVEAVSPAVLWIDEIEMGVGGYREGGDAAMSRIFSGFLTWMQEKSALVFVAATANRIQLLPAEIIRKGRFDQVFFVDLPTEEERKQIFAIHLKKNRCDPARFDLVFLSKATKGWNGAEIEQAVISAVVESYSEARSVTEEDLHRVITATVPLAVTMEEQIKAIKSWAHDRALNASTAQKM
ncbi:MAG TPA: AAA family ATPase [Thermoanaerobaculia bacterium]|nr:AAA family ATPase [Thermoanaerobaculia bacterium]